MIRELLIVASLVVGSVQAQVEFTGVPYLENFDGMGASGTTPPVGWAFYGGFGGSNSTFTNSISIPASAAGGGSANNTLIADTTLTLKSDTAGYNLALPASTTNRALGTSPTTGQFVALQLSLTNATGTAVNYIRLGYDIRRFISVATENELPGYVPFYSLNNGITWNAIPALVQTIATVPNTVGVTSISPTTIPLAAAWNNGSTLMIRWLDDNATATSPDQIYGLDNVAVSLPAVNPPTVTLTAPGDGTVHYLGGTITLMALASDDGNITKVEFFNGTTKLGEDNSEPYQYNWSGYPTGNFSPTARATDNDGNQTTSTASAITVYATPGSGALTRGPYLNSSSQNSIVIRWRSSQSVVGRVRYGTTAGSSDMATDELIAKTDHEVKLTGLSPQTRYYYSVGSSVDALTPEASESSSFTPGAPPPTAADYTFRTSPTPGTAVSARIWIVGDCGRGTQVQAGGRDAYYSYNGNASFTGTRMPDLNLQLGDNAYFNGTDAEYQTGYFSMYANLFRKVPQWSCLGNHDADGGSTNTTANFPYFDMFTFPKAGECGGVASGTEHYYSFDYGNIHFICLDSQASNTAVDNPATTGVNEDGPMATWLRADLASNTATWTIAFWHHPPYSKGSHDSDTEVQMVNMRTNFNPILENGGVDLLYFGHSHNYERSVLLDGHYDISSTITTAMKKNAGNGSIGGFTTSASGTLRNAGNGFTPTATINGTVIPGDGAYIKPLTGPRDHFGAVYNTAGMSGLADAGPINHTAMYICYNSVGTVNLDVNGNTLTSTFVQTGGATPDNFTITKQGAADTDGDGISDAYEIANGLDRHVNDAAGNADSDELSNFLEFAFGLNPNVSDSTWLQADAHGASLTKRGTPAFWYQSLNGTNFQIIFLRRKDAVEAGLVYSPQFSVDLIHWETSTATPTVVASDSEMEAVSLSFPLFPASSGASFFRVGVRSNH